MYLYVEDNVNLFVNSAHFQQVNIHTNSSVPSNVGSHPTSPNVEIEILNTNRMDITNKLEENLMEFSYQTGLWVILGNLHFHSGLFTCNFKLGKKEQTQLLYLNLIGEHEVTLPAPRYIINQQGVLNISFL